MTKSPHAVAAIIFGIGACGLVNAQDVRTRKPPVKVTFEDVDVNKDEKATFDEFVEGHKKSLKVRFERADKNKDGVITAEEFDRKGAARGRVEGSAKSKAATQPASNSEQATQPEGSTPKMDNISK